MSRYATRVRSTMKAPDFSKIMDASLIRNVQQRVVDGPIKSMIQAGTSPVKGFGRYGAYTAVKENNKSGYPYGKKPLRPVNLTRSGDMLRELGAFNNGSVKSFFIGIFPQADQQIRDRAHGNNYGTAKGIPVRRFIPSRGEEFKVSVVAALREVFAEAIQRMLRRKG